jgi:hypothetical protein
VGLEVDVGVDVHLRTTIAGRDPFGPWQALLLLRRGAVCYSRVAP